MHVGVISFTDVDYGLDLSNALCEAGARVTYYTSRKHVVPMVSDEVNPEEALYKKGLLPPEIAVRLIRLRRMRDPLSFTVMQSVARQLRKDRVDVVHIVMGGGEVWTSLLANLVRDLPVASTIIIPQPNVGEYPPAPVVVWTNRVLARGTDLVIINGRNHFDCMQEMYHYPLEKVRYVPLGPRSISLKWSKTTAQEERGTILFIGRINQYKGLEYLVKAQPMISKEVPWAKILIAGQGDDLERCRGFIVDPSKFDIRDGFVPGEVFSELFQKASVIAVPYLTAATSGVIMTAYVFGKPVVTTRVGSLPEYLQDGVTGFLVEPRNEKQLAEALVKILSDDDLRHRMGQNAASWVQGELSWKAIAVQTLSAYADTIAIHNQRKGLTD